MTSTAIWHDDTDRLSFPPPRGIAHADVVVIGAGIAGVTAALLLQQRGKQVALLDAHGVGCGETGNTTAHLTELLDARYHDLERALGTDVAWLVAESSRRALDCIDRLISQLDIDCDFRRLPAYLFAETATQHQTLEREVESLRRAGIDAEWTSAPAISPDALATLSVKHQAQLHPLRYLRALLQEFVRLGGAVFEDTTVVAVHEASSSVVLRTHDSELRARDVLMLTHTPIATTLRSALLQLKLAAYRSYALAARIELPLAQGLYFDMHDPYHYMRLHPVADGALLVAGGADHKTGQCDDTFARHQQLEQHVRRRCGEIEVVRRWSGQIIESADGLPFIGRLSPDTEHVYFATGFCGTGITFGTLAAQMLADAVLGIDNPWRTLYAPDRGNVMQQVPTMLREGVDYPHFVARDRLVRRKVKHVEDVPRGHAEVLRLQGKLTAVYRDEHGIAHVRSAVCPHMGCIVHWNNVERSWDCPCHGSRFNAAGEVLNGPTAQALAAHPVLREPVRGQTWQRSASDTKRSAY